LSTSPQKLLVIDHNTDNAALLVRTLIRKYPRTPVVFCRDPAFACATVAAEAVDAVVLHRSDNEDAVTIIRMLHAVAPALPIVVVSGVDRSESVIAAGAVGFLNYDEWLRIGIVVENFITRPRPGAGGAPPLTDPRRDPPA
jgi:DNA-binding NtrC family response regulator